MKDFRDTFAEAQARNMKRAGKILDALIVADSTFSFQMLETLLVEEREKRIEEKQQMLASMLFPPDSPKGRAVMCLVHEITDDTVIHLLESYVSRLKESHQVD